MWTSIRNIAKQILIAVFVEMIVAAFVHPWLVERLPRQELETDAPELAAGAVPEHAGPLVVPADVLQPHLRTAIAEQPPPQPLPAAPPPAPAPVPTPETFTVHRVDNEHLDARLIVLSDQYTWKHGSDREVTIAGSARSGEEVIEHLRRLRGQMERASHVVAVGMASRLGAREDEERRARARAGQLAQWLEEAADGFGYRPYFWKLSLGQYRGSEADSDDQRRVVVLMLTPKVESGELTEKMLRQAWDQARPLDGERELFSEFELRRFGHEARIAAPASP